MDQASFSSVTISVPVGGCEAETPFADKSILFPSSLIILTYDHKVWTVIERIRSYTDCKGQDVKILMHRVSGLTILYSIG